MAETTNHKMMTIRGKLAGEGVTNTFTRSDGSEGSVLNFSIVKPYGKDKEYIRCCLYGNKSEGFEYAVGDDLSLYGYFKIVEKDDKTYRNFIVVSFKTKEEQEEE